MYSPCFAPTKCSLQETPWKIENTELQKFIKSKLGWGGGEENMLVLCANCRIYAFSFSELVNLRND